MGVAKDRQRYMLAVRKPEDRKTDNKQPQERPLRTKRPHRRPIASTPPAADYSGGQQQQTSQPTAYQSLIYDQPTHQHESPYGPQPPVPTSNGHEATESSPPQRSSLQESDPAPTSQNNTLSDTQGSASRTLIAIPAPSPFAMFFENNYLSQPHKHSGARTESDLEALAVEHWNSSQYANQRKMFEAQAAKQRRRYEEATGQRYDEAASQSGDAGTGSKGKGEDKPDGDSHAGATSDVEMSDVDGKHESRGFKSVN